MSKVWFSVVLGAAALFGLPSISAAQHGGMHGGGFRQGMFPHNMNRRFFDPRFGGFGRGFDRQFDFNRRFFDPRFGGFGRGRFDRFEDRFESRFNRGFFLPF